MSRRMGGYPSGEGNDVITVVVSPAELAGDEVEILGHSYRHLFRARRLSRDEEFRLVDGAGSARFGRATEVGAASARLELGGPAPSHEPAKHLELLAPVPKASRLSWMVEKATEVGVSAIRLIFSERAPRKIGSAAFERLRRVATAAVEQSHRSLVPVITGVHRFDEVSTLMASTPEKWFLQLGADRVTVDDSLSPASLLVGPEGGWTEGEVERLVAWGCRPMGLGPRVLRIETAAVIGSAGLLMKDLF